ncbi:polysaccharide deacetylase family protein [Microvirga sp. CF3062]|uniref:polysaccharide deacetylase family protein n=1 Tax=Microvirga sp. CF3062 TaxID=3110182 RepID=UPI002E75C0A7|nr:polysaccharide deacetylase family protein [Microvirga sp. CF3062]MEE1657658.1 polysaccharide deacetylase family protein [Microvirga sp. CF3062]
MRGGASKVFGSRLPEALSLLNFKSQLDLLRSDTLTVLCYHRIGRPDDDQFHGFRPNFSASPEQFKLQMKLLRTLFSPVSLQDVLHWHETGNALPRRAVLVTFDDGYRDNGDLAWPIMRSLEIPGVVFVATDYIGTGKAFLWDFAAYCFEATKHERVLLPLLGETHLSTPSERHIAVSAWVEASKRQRAGKRSILVHALAKALEVSPPPEAFARLCLDWPTIRSLEKEGLEFGGHTHTHPILTQLSSSEAQDEIATSQRILSAELGHPVRAFAYPNGSASDYSSEHEEAVERAGFAMGFSLEPGPTTLEEVNNRPTAVRRLYVGRQDSIPRLLIKCFGAARFASSRKGHGDFAAAIGAKQTSAEAR